MCEVRGITCLAPVTRNMRYFLNSTSMVQAKSPALLDTCALPGTDKNNKIDRVGVWDACQSWITGHCCP
jgi:hypothetical protein